MEKRHENFSPSLPPTSDLIAHDRDPAPVTVLLAKPFEDPFSLVALLFRLSLIPLAILSLIRIMPPMRQVQVLLTIRKMGG